MGGESKWENKLRDWSVDSYEPCKLVMHQLAELNHFESAPPARRGLTNCTGRSKRNYRNEHYNERDSRNEEYPNRGIPAKLPFARNVGPTFYSVSLSLSVSGERSLWTLSEITYILSIEFRHYSSTLRGQNGVIRVTIAALNVQIISKVSICK